MANQNLKYQLLLFLTLTPSIFAMPTATSWGGADPPSLESRDTEFTRIIQDTAGKAVQVNLYWDALCGLNKTFKPPANSSAMMKQVKYGVVYSLKEQEGYDQSLNGIFKSYKISRDIEANEQIDFSTFNAPSAVVTDPSNPGCSQYVGSQGGNLSISVEKHDCMSITAACFRIWRA